ncbi:MAG: methionine--tRNA ligase subunit beta, partial [Anaerococcus vaginalis]
EERLGVKKEEKEEESQSKSQIKIDDFDKLDLVVGKILEVNDHPDADRLLVFKVDIGSETRTIVSSIKEFYKKEELLGKNIAVIKNLKPVKMRGILSEGMLLAAGDDAVLLTTIKDCKPGTVIS